MAVSRLSNSSAKSLVLRWLACARLVGLVVMSAMGWGASVAHAQIAVNESWRTLRTPHFRVHFTQGTERIGRRAAAAAERAYANLARELVPPRGVIDLVITDAADVSNGLASVFPRNHIIVDARPPVDETSLESYDDWMTLVLQHEVTHIFHLDRSRGWWRASQMIFGRNPVLFPNFYTPSWLAEGLAVYYESRFTSGGRLEGSYQYSVARAAAIDRKLPRLDQLSLVTSRYPYGQGSYIYGAFVVDALAHHGGPESVRRFVERSSGQMIPFLLDRAAKRSFGETFTQMWRAWRDSVTRSATQPVPPGQDWRVVPRGGRYIIHPRWVRDSATILYLADNGRESPGVYIVTPQGTVRRAGRRTSFGVHAVGPDGRIVFAQDEFVDRLHVYSDLYETRNGITRRLTVGQRLSAPDVRADGEIVAVQTLPGTTRLVRVIRSGPHRGAVTPLTPVSLDTQWAAPRWSPRQTQMAAVRLIGGTSEIVVLDTMGAIIRAFGRAHAVTRSPAWAGDGSGVFFTSDRSGVSQVYFEDLATPDTTISQVTDFAPGLFYVDARGDHPAAQLVTTYLRADGYHVATFTPRAVGSISSRDTSAVALYTLAAGTPAASHTDLEGHTTPYRPWRTLVPSYWSPIFSNGSTYGSQIGALTSGSDVIGRHSYTAQGLMNTKNHLWDGVFDYRYSRWMQPVLDLSAEQTWSYGSLYNSQAQRLGDLRKRTRVYSLHTTFTRQRVFTASALTLGGELETREYFTNPAPLQANLSPFYQRIHHYPTMLAAASFSNAQRPTLSISPEDGVSGSLAFRQRWERGVVNSGSGSTVAILSMYKSLDLPGFAHHVLALRLAGGLTDTHSPSEYSVGGISGGSLSIIPGVSIGDQARTFPVRGFAPGTEQGIRAGTASLEYRIPVSIPSRGIGLLPVFVDRTSLTLFADAGEAYCPAPGVTASSSTSRITPCGTSDYLRKALASVGAELNIDSALQFDVPYRFRAGFAHPVSGQKEFGARSTSIYVTLGGSF